MMFLRLLLLKLKAVLGDARAAYVLGEALLTGVLHPYDPPIRKDRLAARKWYLRGARLGDRDSQYELGFMYLLGEGIPADPSEGVRWMKAAAEHDYAEPMRVLADSYAIGKFGVAVDPAEAERWRSRLAAYLAAHPEDRCIYERGV